MLLAVMLWLSVLLRETALEIARRGVAFLEWLRDRPEECVSVVTHSAFLVSLFNQVVTTARPHLLPVAGC